MYVLVDLAIDKVELADPDAVHDFSVVVANGTDIVRVGSVLTAAGAGRLVDDPDGLEPDHAWISVEWLRDAAVGRVGSGWDGHLASMVDKAKKHGWVDGDGSHLKAHVAWPDEEEPGA